MVQFGQVNVISAISRIDMTKVNQKKYPNFLRKIYKLLYYRISHYNKKFYKLKFYIIQISQNFVEGFPIFFWSFGHPISAYAKIAFAAEICTKVTHNYFRSISARLIIKNSKNIIKNSITLIFFIIFAV